MIIDLDPQAIAQRDAQTRVQKANMAMQFCVSLAEGGLANTKSPEQLVEYGLTMAERLHQFIVGPQPSGILPS